MVDDLKMEELKDMKTKNFNLIIPKSPYGPPKERKPEENLIKLAENLSTLVLARSGSLFTVQYLGYNNLNNGSCKISKAGIDLVYLDNVYRDLRNENKASIYFGSRSIIEGGIGIRGYNEESPATAVRVIDSFNTVLYKDSEAEKEWFGAFKKIKEMVTPAEKAKLCVDHKARENALVEYSILKYLSFMANLRTSEED